MEQHQFDRWLRALAGEVSRRGVLKRFAATAAGGPVALAGVAAADGQGNKDKDKDKDDRDRCRAEGESCRGGQQCCPGLACLDDGRCGVRSRGGGQASGGTTSQATVNNNVTVVNESDDTQVSNVNQTGIDSTQSADVEQVGFDAAGSGGAAGGFTPLPAYTIEVDCTYEAAAFQTVCVAIGRAPEDAPRVRKITLPQTEICAFVIDEESTPAKVEVEEVVVTRPGGGGGGGGGQASAGTGGTANADASGDTVSIGDVNSGDNRGDDNDTTISIDASGGTANADASGGDNNVAIAGGGGGGQETREVVRRLREVEPSRLTIVLEGNVQPGRPTTYWLDTEAGRLPASGPALSQVEADDPAAGAVLVDAFACGIGAPQEGYDWFGQCQEPAAPLEFALFAEGSDTPLATQRANERGRARFGNLAPGTYRLTPTDGTWCHAESNSVDAGGNVVVSEGQESNVWILHLRRVVGDP